MNEVCNIILKLKPKSVLDIGCGHGKFGFLAREYTDVFNERMFKRETKIDAVEVYDKYITELQRQIYDRIFIGNVLDLWDQFQHYDLGMCFDMLEHMNKPDGLCLLRRMPDKFDNFLLSTPVVVSHQKIVYDNIHEVHRSAYTKEELEQYGKVSIIENTYFLENVKR